MILQAGQELQGIGGDCFQVLQWEGEGSYARVYRARACGREDGTGDGAAIKLAKTEVEGAADRLRREQAAHARVCHPAIPALLDAGENEGVPWLALRWVTGETLRRRLEQARGLALVQAVPILLRITEAVTALHAAGWSHGDLRPDNVLLESGTQQAFLLDLSEAEPLGEDCRPPAPVKVARPRGWLRWGGGGTGGRGDGATWGRDVRTRPLAPSPPRPVPPSFGDAAARDLCQLGELLAWILTGVDPAVEPDRLSRASGYHPAAVQLWHEAREGRLSSAAAFRAGLEDLARHLGRARV